MSLSGEMVSSKSRMDKSMSEAKIGAKGLIRLTTATAFIVGFLIALVPAGAYFAVEYTQIQSSIEAEANINARLVSQLVSKNPQRWEDEQSELLTLVALRPVGKTLEARQIKDNSGKVVAESSDPLGNWRVVASSPILHDEKELGHFEITQSISDILANTTGILLVSLWFATWSYLILRILPDRALKQALSDASAAKEVAYSALRDRDKAEEAARLRSVFLANMSHELRTPMNGVLGMLDLITDTELDDEQKEYVSLASSSGKHLLDIINDILDFSKIDEGNLTIVPALFNLQELLAQTSQLFQKDSQKKGLTLENKLAADLPPVVKADPVRVRQILVKLIGNAVKFTSQGGVKLQVTHETNEGKNFINFMVEDTGGGIPQDKLEYIFQPFTQADESATRKHGGTGLGLAISKQLASAMGGNLSATSELNKGSIFHLRIPVDLPA